MRLTVALLLLVLVAAVLVAGAFWRASRWTAEALEQGDDAHGDVPRIPRALVVQPKVGPDHEGSLTHG